MKTAIVLHGMPGEAEYRAQDNHAANQHWLPWLVEKLKQAGIEAVNPELPEPYRPDYEKWKEVFGRFPVNEETILVGHSAGGGFLVRWLSENKVKVGKVALVAPWIDPLTTDTAPNFFDFEIDAGMASRTTGMRLFISHDDDKEELVTAANLKKMVAGLQVQEFTDKGHFTIGDMKTEAFPELAEFLLA